jgi:tetratricopeptide (TPR) repeat protein
MGSRTILVVLSVGLIFLAAGTVAAQQPAGTTGTQAQPKTALEWEQHGDVHMARKEYADAGDAYLRALRLQPKSPVLLNKTGITYHQQHLLAQARDYYKKAIKADGKYAEAINNLGTIEYAEKKYKQAIRQYNTALQFKETAAIYSNLGTAYFARKMYPETLAAYGKAVALDPEVFERSSAAGQLMQEKSVEDRARFHFFLARTFAAAADAQRAFEYLKKALEEGYKDREGIQKDPAFTELLKTEPFQQLLANPPAIVGPGAN